MEVSVRDISLSGLKHSHNKQLSFLKLFMYFIDSKTMLFECLVRCRLILDDYVVAAMIKLPFKISP